MQFSCDGIDYDSEEMLCPLIEDREFLMVFITPDLHGVFGASTVRGEGTKVRRINGRSLAVLAERTQICELLDAASLNRRRVHA